MLLNQVAWIAYPRYRRLYRVKSVAGKIESSAFCADPSAAPVGGVISGERRQRGNDNVHSGRIVFSAVTEKTCAHQIINRLR